MGHLSRTHTAASAGQATQPAQQTECSAIRIASSASPSDIGVRAATNLRRESEAWWRGAVIYQIYPRSFADSNGDGVGDLRGIIGKLDYVAALGADIVWISPFYPSPMKDFGYDVSDYRAVDPLFGTIEDFDDLIARARTLGLKIMIDQVWSHTSDKHDWFADSRRSRTSEKADWYVWADPRPDGSPPNNWLSVFGGSAWTWDSRRRQYYLHHFLASQPQLNLHNEEVVEAVLEVARFWLDRGVHGFRLDAIDFMFHDPALRDNPPRPLTAGNVPVRPFGMQQHVHDMLQPQTMEFMARLRGLMRDYPGAITLGEVSSEEGAFQRCAAYTDAAEERLDMAYTLAMMKGPLSPQRLRDVLMEIQPAVEDGCVCWAFSNHDVVRAITRWGSGREDPRFGRLLMALLGILPGIPCIYQGEELGLGEAKIAPEDMRDPYGISFYPAFIGRDGCRTPMPWAQGDRLGGFTNNSQAWLPMPAEHLARAADRQASEAASLLNDYRRFLRWRKSEPAVLHGGMRVVTVPEPLFAIERIVDSRRILAVFNLEARAVSLSRSELPHCRAIDPIPSEVAATPESLLFPPYGVFLAVIDG
jgi:alpha-glucosidase